MKDVKDTFVVIGSALVVALFAACTPSMVVPAEGTRLHYDLCGQTPQGISVATYAARCPTMARITERARRVRESYPTCSLDGVKVYVVGAYVICNDEPVRGCTSGNTITVTDDAFVVATIEHEFRHVCITQVHGPTSLGHYDLDHRREQLDEILHGERL